MVDGVAAPRKLKSLVTKNKLPNEDRMNLSNNNIYVMKSYLKFFKWVADRMQGFKLLANAIDKFRLDFNQKIITKQYNSITYFHPHTSHITH